MFVLLTFLIASAVAAPTHFDQRQDGEFNVQADLQNIVFIVGYPQKMMNLANLFFKSVNTRSDETAIQDRADVQVMKSFVEPSTPYRVEIGSVENRDESIEGDGSADVVIAGRRSGGVEPAAERDELKLLGATEQCGPDRQRDPVTLACIDLPPTDDQHQKTKAHAPPANPTSEVVPT